MKNVISLFSGALGLDIGLDNAGFSLSLAVEKDPWAVKTIHLNRPRLPVIEKPIEEVTSAEILEKSGLKPNETTIISAGPCCQSFSTVGNRRSIADPRGSLFREFCRVVADIRPRFFVMENVKGILSAAVKHRILNERGPGYPPLTRDEVLGSALSVLCKELADLNYHVVFGLLNAADFGVPQKRWRVFFIGSRDGEEISLPMPTHQDIGRATRNEKTLTPWVTLREALTGVRAKHWCEFTQDRVALLRHLRPGQNWRDLPPKLHPRALGAAFNSWGGRSGFCRRLSWSEPSPTLTTAPDGRATTLCHPTADRPLSVEEYAALQ
jgi:DNA (cytosine-5)-methyltransferase 1